MNENDKYTVLNNEHLRFFKFRLGDFTGSRLKYEKKILPKFYAIDVKGFKRLNNSKYYILYSVDKQVIRKLKMMSLCNEIKRHSHQDYLLQLMHSSTEIEENEIVHQISSSNWYSYDSLTSRRSEDYDSEEVLMQRQQNRYRANRHNY